MATVPSPPPSGGFRSLVIAAALLALVAAGIGGWLAFRSPTVPPPGPPSPVTPRPTPPAVDASPAGSPGASPNIEEAQKITREINGILATSASAMVKNPHAVKPPYPWKPLPEKYRRLSALVRGRAGEEDFWLRHARMLALPYARLSDAVGRDPDNPDAPALLTVGTENARGRDFDATSRQIALTFKARSQERSPVLGLMEALFFILSGDTLAATEILNKLPPVPPGPTAHEQHVGRFLAQCLLAYGVKLGDKPAAWARKGLDLLSDRLGENATSRDWEWALILLYAAVPSLFHEDYGGRREAAPEVVEKGIELVGRGPRGRSAVPAGVDGEMVEESRKVIRDAAKRGTDYLGSLMRAQPSARDMKLGCLAARWFVTVADEAEEGRLWYGLYLGFIAPGAKALGGSADPEVKIRLAQLVTAISERQPRDKTGVMSACKGRLAQGMGDATLAAQLLAEARARAGAAGYKENDLTIWEALDAFETELKMPGTPSPRPSSR
ncbi:MAG: hypothetical protein HY815_07800 [Candidatus Riflebacteria bacterium]|nr:hypothetical protein [Candidatus Riflebacteria bacterium]